MPAIDKVLEGKKFVYTKAELKYVLQQLHRHRREAWQISLNEAKLKLDRKRKGINSRRSEVSIQCIAYRITDILIKFYFFLKKKKKERRQRGILHMYNTDDEILLGLKPMSITNDEYKEDMEQILSDGRYHSDEVSETDDEMAREEIAQHMRPKNKTEDDIHVIHVYDKPWRSRRVSKIKFGCFLFTYDLLF
jgi:hypothetical protein